jgi:hypothetical protein
MHTKIPFLMLGKKKSIGDIKENHIKFRLVNLQPHQVSTTHHLLSWDPKKIEEDYKPLDKTGGQINGGNISLSPGGGREEL